MRKQGGRLVAVQWGLVQCEGHFCLRLADPSRNGSYARGMHTRSVHSMKVTVGKYVRGGTSVMLCHRICTVIYLRR